MWGHRRVHEHSDIIHQLVRGYVFRDEACDNIYGNDKPWFTTDIKHKLTAKNAFVSGNTDEYRKAKGDVRKAIKKAKYKYKSSLEEQFANNNTKSVWQGLRQITQYKQSEHCCH